MSDPVAIADPPTLTYDAVCAGRRWMSHGVGLAARWYKLKSDGTADETNPMSFAVKGKKTTLTNTWVGDVYEINERGDTFAVSGHRKQVYNNPDLLQKWRVEERAAEAQAEMERKQKKSGSDFGDMTFKELAEQYEKTIGSARKAALLAAAIQAITG